jgi:hypothetical protein
MAVKQHLYRCFLLEFFGVDAPLRPGALVDLPGTLGVSTVPTPQPALNPCQEQEWVGIGSKRAAEASLGSEGRRSSEHRGSYGDAGNVFSGMACG